MNKRNWKLTKPLPSPRLIPEWKDLKHLINNILCDIKIEEEFRPDALVLSDWPEILYKETHHSQNKPFVYFYSLDTSYFISLNWMEQYEKQMQAVLWIQDKDIKRKRVIKKTKFPMTVQVPPIKTMVHVASHHMLIAYCDDMHLWLFGDHHQAFTCLTTVPCRLSINCLCYDSETGVLFSGTLGAVVTWLIIPEGKGLQMAQTVPMSGRELVQGLSLNTSLGFLWVLCENMVRVFTIEGQGQLKEVKTFSVTVSGSSLTCSHSCVSQSTFYAGNRNGEIHAWGLDEGNFLHSFKAHSSPVICVYSRPETHTLFTAGSEGVLREWNLASGDLLRQLSIDKDLQQLQFIDNTTVFCQSSSSFSLHHLPYFYSLFNICGSAPQKMQRVYCGHNWTRILCATEDGLLRFLSPVTGDLLVITWPLLAMDNAVAWAYDSEREELYVAIGSPEVLVFDATRSPCTAKYLVCTSENQRDKVKCLAYLRSHLGNHQKGLMFCGHESGIVRILSQYCSARTEKNVHSGAVLALSTLEGLQESPLLCSYGKDNFIHLTEAVLSGNNIILQPVSEILCAYPLKHVVLLPGSVGAITEHSCWYLWRYQDFLASSERKRNSMSRETNCLHECAVTSFDICLTLKLFVTGATDGSVRLWDFCGRLVTQLDSALRFGSLCFANNRGDLLLSFNQSIYLVSCLKLLPPRHLMRLDMLKNVCDVQETPKPFLPSFFFLFEIIFVPKFIYLGQTLQELQGLEPLVNKRVIAFDNTVPHVVEEGRPMPVVTPERPGLYFLKDRYTDLSPHDSRHKYPYAAPAQLHLPDWDGLNAYRMLRCFFGKGRKWPFAPDCYIPNSVIRACLWPEGTPIFLRYDLHPSTQDQDLYVTEELRPRSLSSVILKEEDGLDSQWKDKYLEQKRISYGVLESMTNKSWVGRKFSDGLVENLIETILNLTVYCSVEKYRKYFNALTQIFANYQIPSRMRIETASRLLKDITHSQIRELAWEMLERLGFISHLFTIPMVMGLMDSEKNVRTKVLYLMPRYTGIQTKTMLLHLLRKRDILQELQTEMSGEASLSSLLRVQANDMQCLLGHVKERLNENLTLSQRDSSLRFSLDSSKYEELEIIAEQTVLPLTETEKITELKKRKRRAQEKSRNIIKKTLRISKRPQR